MFLTTAKRMVSLSSTFSPFLPPPPRGIDPSLLTAVVDKMLMVDMLVWALLQPVQPVVILITGDQDFY
jgi:hypothetical protein